MVASEKIPQRLPFYHFSLAILFIALLMVPAVGFFFNKQLETSLKEKRQLAEFPVFSLTQESIKAFPSKFENYVADHFGFRDTLIYVHNLIKIRIFKKSTISSVTIGKDGWLFWAKTKILEDYRGKIPFKDTELNTWKKVLENRHQWLLEKGIQYFYVIPPNKHTIYSEHLPEYINRKKGKMRLDQFVSFFKANSTVPVLDLRGPLFEAKKTKQVYYRTDMHWNYVGGYVGYKYLVSYLKKYHLELPLVTKDSLLELKGEKIGDLAQYMGLERYFNEDIPVISLKHTCAERIPFEISNLKVSRYFSSGCKNQDKIAVIFRDSFLNYMTPFLSESFKQVVYVWHPYNHTTMKMVLRTIKPDVVIDEVLQRYLASSPPIENGEMNEGLDFSKLTRQQKLMHLDAFGNMDEIKPNRQTQLHLDSYGLQILASDKDPALYLPKIDTATQQKDIVIHMAISAPRDTVVQFFYKTQKHPYFSQANSISRPIIKGFNDIFIQTSKENMTGEFRLDPGALPGQYTLHAIDINTIEWL